MRRRRATWRKLRIKAQSHTVGFGAPLVSLLVLLSPNASGSSFTVLIAPYGPGPLVVWNVTHPGGCGRVNLSPSPFFHARSGEGGFAERLSVPLSCQHHIGGGETAATGFRASVPVHLTRASASIVAVVQVRAWISADAAMVNCTPVPVANWTNSTLCGRLASATILGTVLVHDLTTDSYWVAQNSWAGISRWSYSWEICSGSNCTTYQNSSNSSAQVSNSFAWTFALTSLSPAHRFALVLNYQAYAMVGGNFYGANPSPGNTTAVINVGSRGDCVCLASVTIS